MEVHAAIFFKSLIRAFPMNRLWNGSLLIRAKITITIICDVFKWMFVYCKCYIWIELSFLKEFILIKQVHQKSVIFITIGISYIMVLSFNQMSQMGIC